MKAKESTPKIQNNKKIQIKNKSNQKTNKKNHQCSWNRTESSTAK